MTTTVRNSVPQGSTKLTLVAPSDPREAQNAASRVDQLVTGGGPQYYFENGRVGLVELILMDALQRLDPQGLGLVTESQLQSVLLAPDLNLQLTEAQLFDVTPPIYVNQDGTVNYSEYVMAFRMLLCRACASDPPSAFDWVQLQSSNGIVYYNKRTGLAGYEIGEEYGTLGGEEWVTDCVMSYLQLHDTQQNGYVAPEAFSSVLQGEELGLFLTADEVDAILQLHPAENGLLYYPEIATLCFKYVVHLYQEQPKDEYKNYWVYLRGGVQSGAFWFNKRDGFVTKQVPSDVLALVNKPKGYTEDLEEQLDKAHEELMDARVDLEQATNKNKEYEESLQKTKEENASESEKLRVTLAEMEARLNDALANSSSQQGEVKTRLEETEAALQTAQRELEEANTRIQAFMSNTELTASLDERDRLAKQVEEAKAEGIRRVEEVQRQLTSLASITAAKDSEIDQLKRDVQDAKDSHEKTKQLYKSDKRKSFLTELDVAQAQELRASYEKAKQELADAKKALDERSRALSVARNQYKDLWEKTATQEKDIKELEKLRLDLHDAREEIRTLKALLSGKTKLIQERNSDISLLQQKINELENKDEKRTKILEDVLERTARIQQERVSSPVFEEPHRPLSASPVPQHATLSPVVAAERPPRTPSIHTAQRPLYRSPMKPVSPDYHSTSPSKGRGTVRAEQRPPLPLFHHRNHPTVLPPITPEQPKSDPALPHVHVGDRVLVRGNKEVGGFSKQLTGLVKYVGLIDSDGHDMEIYIGLKLDDGVGNTDGIVNGKRYFKSPEQHGAIFRLADVLSVLSSKHNKSGLPSANTLKGSTSPDPNSTLTLSK